ncbi:HD domain-containing phosphohydrolase [Planctomicrobium sp. SH661]|uniref:HD domain-containing phosphohydrolase n=1 Tax=Planctomicrobium sp. SH661 TaxID=3448124 RepID=UPI003F5C2E10
MRTQTLYQEHQRTQRADLLSMAAAITGIDVMQNSGMQDDSDPFAVDRKTARLLVVDDEPINVDVVCAYLEDEGYSNILTYTDSVAALIALEHEQFDVALLDIMMPRISGLDLLQQMRDSRHLRHIPCIVMTASTDRSTKRSAIELGAADFLNKPFDPEELLSRTQNALIRKAHYDQMQVHARDLERQVTQRTAELVSSQIQLIHCLGRAAEYRDNDTGRHVLRVGRFSGIIADQLGLDKVAVQQIELAASLHDIGKLGVPDSILQKPGRLDPNEMVIMQQHAALGHAIIAPHTSSPFSIHDDNGAGDDLVDSFESPLLKLAATIAATHHERWDGSGYPYNMKGEDIPLPGRIVAVADVFDALSTRRPYKNAFPFDECVNMIRQGSGSHFDPAVVEAFLQRLPEIKLVYLRYQDQETSL